MLSINSLTNAQVDTSYSFIVAGHAYGAHDGGNLGLHPAFLNSLNLGYDSNAAFIVFTGDIVNNSTPESWQQVEDELVGYALPYYYVMGNHDNNTAGWQVFEDKYGSTYYSFYLQSELFIVLNSTEEQRSISSNQIDFMDEQIELAGDSIQNVFIFFHEVLWNSHEKYVGVRSNSRSRYDQIVNYSNYWEEVHPILLAKPEINFYINAGDVGGNPDAIAAFYDEWDHVTFLSSGMGEVADENYLLVHVNTKDSIEFELVPLNNSLSLDDIEYYSVPSSIENITGPATVLQGSVDIEYSVPEVFNADSYIWELPEGTSGLSSLNSILLDFDWSFAGDSISVNAVRDGYGTGPGSSMTIAADISPIELIEGEAGSLHIDFIENDDYSSTVGISCNAGDMLTINLFDSMGRILKSEKIEAFTVYTEMHLGKTGFPKGVYFLSVSTQTQHLTEKFVIR